MKIGLRAAGLGLFLGLCFSAMSGVTQSPAIQTTGEPQADAGLTVLAHLPKLLSGGEPEYPSDAMAARVEASIIVRVNINEKGEVATAGIVGLRQRYGSITDQGKGWSAEVLRAHNSLCQAALNSVLGRRYQPTTLDDKAVPVLATEIIGSRAGRAAGRPLPSPHLSQ